MGLSRQVVDYAAMAKMKTRQSTAELLAQASGPTAPVPKDPQPSVDRIDELARRILTGDILLPKFQRNFVWERPQIIQLLDSVARGFPIGSILLWQSRQELRSEKKIAELDIELPRPDYPVNYLLDGQQRLSTICGAMFWAVDDKASRWNIVYDLREQSFIHLDSLNDPPLHQIRANRLSDATAYFKHVASLDTLTAVDKTELKHRAEGLFSRFKDYKIATVTLGDMQLQDVAPIFERINSTGTALTIVDLMRAATWSQEFDLVDTIDGIRESLDEKRYGDIDKKVILRSISAASGGGFSSGSIDALRNHQPEALTIAAAEVDLAYRRVVDFLVTHIGIPRAEAIPYSNQITVLAELFRRLPNPTAEQYAAIEQWFWRTSVSGYFSGWNTGMMSSDHDAVRRFADGATTEIEVEFVIPRPDIWRIRQFRLNAAHAKLLGFVLAHMEPVDLLTGQRIDVDKALSFANSKEFHHFFPQAFLKDRGESATRINVLSNIIMLTAASNKTISKRAPSDYLSDVAASAGGSLQEWLDSNLIPYEAFDAGLADNYEAFLELRSTAINNFMMRKTGWEAPAVAPIRSRL